MTKEELIQFLKENLTVYLDIDYEYGYGGGEMVELLRVKIMIADEVINESSVKLGKV